MNRNEIGRACWECALDAGHGRQLCRVCDGDTLDSRGGPCHECHAKGWVEDPAWDWLRYAARCPYHEREAAKVRGGEVAKAAWGILLDAAKGGI